MPTAMTTDPAATPAAGTPPEQAPAVSATAVGDQPRSTPDATAGTDGTGTVEPESFLNDEEYAKVKDDPNALRTALNKAWTQKTQGLAEKSKRLDAWTDVVDAFESDPRAAVTLIAKRAGLEVREPSSGAASEKPTVTDAGDQAVTEMRTALEEFGLGELAEKITPAIRKMAETIAAKHIAPVAEDLYETRSVAAKERLAGVMKQFGEKYPDWKTHEKAMMALAERVKPAVDAQTGRPAISELDYLEQLYFLVNRDGYIKTAVTKQVEAMQRAATTAAEHTSGRVSSEKVGHRPPANATFADAAAAAKRGEVWE